MTKTDTIELNLAHSPDSDDLVMWWPLVGVRHPDGTPIEGDLGRPQIDTGPFRFNLIARDVEELNKLVIGTQSSIDSDTEPAYDITAISCATYPAIADRYAMTSSGGSFGENYGPRIVVAKDSPYQSLEDLKSIPSTLAIPGINTSAFMTLQMAIGKFNYQELLFSDIPDAVAQGRADAGLLIHEAQLTHSDFGLREIGDLGKWWFSQTQMPLPLGLNVIKRDLDDRYGPGTCESLARVLNASVNCCVEMGEASRMHLQLNKGDRTEWDDPELVDKYLSMYVSQLTIDMGDTGRDAIRHFLSMASERGLCKKVEKLIVL
jgi:5,8-dihydroxy-2-naphthoate synthase